MTNEASDPNREGGLPAPCADDRALVDQLESIGYVEGSQEAPARDGVAIHDRSRTHAGLNLMTSRLPPDFPVGWARPPEPGS